MTATTWNFISVGVFDHRNDAEHALLELRRQGISCEQTSLSETTSTETDGPSGPPTFETGAGVGMLAGAAVGGLAGAGLPGLLAGGLAGGLFGAVIDLGIPEADARFYQDDVDAGRTVLVVQSDDAPAVEAVMTRLNAKRVRTLPTVRKLPP